jgi:hypothetical protein
MDKKKLVAGTTVDILPLAEAASLAPSATTDPTRTDPTSGTWRLRERSLPPRRTRLP